MKKISFFLALLLFPLFIFAQAKHQEDVIYLKNGGVLRGHIIDSTDNDPIHIQIEGGSIFVVEHEDIEKQTKEAIFQAPKVFLPKTKGYSIALEIGLTFGNDGIDSAIDPNINLINAYRFNPRLSVGLGSGLYFYTQQEYSSMAFFANVRGLILPGKRVSPFYYLDIGTAFPIVDLNDTWFETKAQAGPHFAGGIGTKISGNRGFSWTLSVGYHLQNISFKEIWNNAEQSTQYKYRRFALKTGFWF